MFPVGETCTGCVAPQRAFAGSLGCTGLGLKPHMNRRVQSLAAPLTCHRRKKEPLTISEEAAEYIEILLYCLHL